MKSFTSRFATVSLAVVAAIAMPITVKAEAGNLSATSPAASASEAQISTEADYWCIRIPGYGMMGPGCPPR